MEKAMIANVKLSTIFSEEHNKFEKFRSEPFTFANGVVGSSLIPLDRRKSHHSSDVVVWQYLDITGLNGALYRQDYSDIDPSLDITFSPFSKDLPKSRICINSSNSLYLSAEYINRFAKVKPLDVIKNNENLVLSYSFLEVVCINSKFHEGDNERKGKDLTVNLTTDLPQNLPRYEKFLLALKGKETAILGNGKSGNSPAASLIANYLSFTGIGDALREYPSVLITEHDGERFTDAKIKCPTDLRIVWDPVPLGLGLPILRISPIKKGIFLQEHNITESQEKPSRISFSPEGIDLSYEFVKIFINLRNNDNNLKSYYGNSIKIEDSK